MGLSTFADARAAPDRMSVLEAMQARRAVREYTPEPVAEAQLRRIIDAAALAPSALNRQDWLFVVVTDPLALDSIAHKAKAHMLSLLEQTPPLRGFREHLSNPAYNIFYAAPALVVICATNNDEMATQDCCLAAENLMLAARDEGLGSCWIGFAEAWLDLPEAKAELGLPANARPVAPIILGHPRAWPASPGRRPAEVRWIRG
jgi:nitroreductase